MKFAEPGIVMWHPLLPELEFYPGLNYLNAAVQRFYNFREDHYGSSALTWYALFRAAAAGELSTLAAK